MKKVIGIFMAMVFVVLMVSMAFGENPKGYNGSEVYTMVEEWARSQNYYDEYNRNLKDGVYHCMGVIEADDFKEITGKDFTMDELTNLYYNNKDYGQDWDVTDARVNRAGFYEGYDVYILDLSTNEVPLGDAWDYDNESYEDYYHVSIIFMVCE